MKMAVSFNFSEADIKEALAEYVMMHKDIKTKPEDVKLTITGPSSDGPLHYGGGVTAIVTPSGPDEADKVGQRAH